LFAESDNFKLFMGDTGLLVTQILRTSNIVQEDLYRKIITGHLGANLGMIFENDDDITFLPVYMTMCL
jgi:hypothetical protein